MENKEINKELDQVKSDIAALRKDMASLLDAVKTVGAEQGKEFYEKAYERARNAGESIREQAGDAYSSFGREVGEYPLVSMLSAFATGFVVGMVLDRRH
jgi:ElaB/YqjD/DUF883 family membrane-anchored ribosome-binding protein